MVRRRSRVLVALAAGLMLAGCAQIPRSSEVVEGGRADVAADSRGLEPVAAGPVRGAGPTQIVQGLVASMASSPDEYSASRSFLQRDTAARWQPRSETVVFTGTPTINLGRAQGGRVSGNVTVTQTATVDRDGRYRRLTPSRKVLQLGLSQDADRQWRVDRLPDATVISTADFQLTYRAHPVYFLSQDLHALVPASRYLPNGAGLPTRLAAAVLAGPPAELREGYGSAVPAGTRLAPPTAIITKGESAIVELTGEAASATQAQRVALRAQLLATLRAVLPITDVRLTVDGGALDVSNDLPAPEPVGAPAGRPLVLRRGQLYTFDGERLAPATGLPDLRGINPELIGAFRGGERVAVVGQGRSRLYLTATGEAVGSPVIRGSNLTQPSFDPDGAVWTSPSPSRGFVEVARGQQVQQVAAPWLAGRRVRSLAVSPDGGLAAVVSTGGGRGRLDVVAIRRDGGGPRELVRRAECVLSLAGENVRAVAWRSPQELIVGADRRVALVPLDGPLTPVGRPLAATTVGSGSEPGVGDLALTASGRLYEYESDGWYRVTGGETVDSVAFPQ